MIRSILVLLLCIFSLPILYSQQKIDSLLNVLNQQERQEDTATVNLLNQIGYEYWIVDASQSEQYGNHALTLAQKLNYASGIAFSNRVLGVSHWARGNYEKAIKYLLNGLNEYRSLSDPLGEANCLMNIGLVYADQSSNQQALDYYFQAIDLFQEMGAQGRIATTYTKMGTIFLHENRLDEAYDYLTRALSIHEEQHFRYGIAEVNNRLGQLFIKKEEYDRALIYLNQSVAVGQEIHDKDGIAKNYELIGQVYIQQKDFTKANTFLDKGLNQALEIGLKPVVKDIYWSLKDLAIAQNNYPQALEYFRRYDQMKDSLFNEEIAHRISNLESKFETTESERQLKVQEQEIILLQQQKYLDNLIMIILGFGIVSLMGLGYLIFSRQRLRLKQNEAQKALAQAELENALLKKKELTQELEFRNKELASYTINFIQKNELMEDLRENIHKIKTESDGEVKRKLDQLNRIVASSVNVDKDWEDFKRHFEQVHHNFFPSLKEYCPQLSTSELKLSALVRLNLNIKESSTILGISPESVKTARYRLRKKLKLNKEDNLNDFIIQLENREWSKKGKSKNI